MKKKFFIVSMILMMTCMGGCAQKVTAEKYIHEAGEELPEDISVYAEFKNEDHKDQAVIDLSNVRSDETGNYEAVITLKNNEYPFTIEVVDTTPPDGEIEVFITEAAKDEIITPESFGIHMQDVSEFECGFRNLKLLTAEEGVYQLFEKNLAKAREEGHSDISVDDLLELDFHEESDTWEEKDVEVSTLIKEIKPEKNGLYSVELIAADIHGNADITKVYILADLSEPVFVQNYDKEITVGNDFEEYLKAATDGLLIKDNYLGNITEYAVVTNTEVIESSATKIRMKVSYEVSDIAGNKATAERILTLKSTFVKQQSVSQDLGTQNNEQTVDAKANGYDKEKAMQAFAAVNRQRSAAGISELAWDEGLYETACRRSSEIVSDFSHDKCPAELGENIASNYRSIDNLINAWMNSQGHKENILDTRYSAGVMACYYYEGSYYWVNLFRF